jgi:hypothetical protein
MSFVPFLPWAYYLQIHLVSCLRDVTMRTLWLTGSTGMAAHTVRCFNPARDGGEMEADESVMLA